MPVPPKMKYWKCGAGKGGSPAIEFSPAFPPRGSLLGDRISQLSPIVAYDFRTQPPPPWHADEIGAGWRSQTMGESGKRTEESWLSSRRFRLSPATEAAVPPASLKPVTFTSHTGSLLLSSLKKVTSFPPQKQPPYSTTIGGICATARKQTAPLSPRKFRGNHASIRIDIIRIDAYNMDKGGEECAKEAH